MNPIFQHIQDNTAIKPHHQWEHIDGVLDELKLTNTAETKTNQLTESTYYEAIVTIVINSETEQVILIAWTTDNVGYYSKTTTLADPQLIQTIIKFTNKWAELAP